MYLPKNVVAVSCAFWSSDMWGFVIFVGLVLGGLNVIFSGGLIWTFGGALGGG